METEKELSKLENDISQAVAEEEKQAEESDDLSS